MADIKGCITRINYNPMTGLPESFTVTPSTGEAVKIALPPAPPGAPKPGGPPLAGPVDEASKGCFEVEVEYSPDGTPPFQPTAFARLKKKKRCCEDDE